MATAVVKPDLPGSVLNWVGDTQQQVETNENEIAAILGTANWGPKGIETGGTALYQSWPAFIADYGSDLSSPGVLAVYQAFRGQDVAGAGGAGGVYFHRLAGSAAAAATKTLNNSAATPAPALKLDALYTGSFGNRLSAIVDADPQNASNHRLRLLLDGVEVEKFSYAQTDIAGLASAINARPSRYVKATSLATGTALALTAGTNFTGGDDGATVTPTDYLNAQRSLEFKDFAVVAPAGRSKGLRNAFVGGVLAVVIGLIAVAAGAGVAVDGAGAAAAGCAAGAAGCGSAGCETAGTAPVIVRTTASEAEPASARMAADVRRRVMKPPAQGTWRRTRWRTAGSSARPGRSPSASPRSPPASTSTR